MRALSDEEAKRLIQKYLLDHPERPATEVSTALQIPQEQARRIMQDEMIDESAPPTGRKTPP